MITPIQSWSDPQLYGASLVSPFERSCQWIKAVYNPIQREGNFVIEIASRVMKLALGILGVLFLAFPALMGRLIQVVHFYAHSNREPVSSSSLKVDSAKAQANLPHAVAGNDQAPPHAIADSEQFASSQIMVSLANAQANPPHAAAANDQALLDAIAAFKQASLPPVIDMDLPPAARSAKEEFFRQKDLLPLSLRFLPIKDLARAASAHRNFATDVIKAAELEVRLKKALCYTELIEFARLKNKKVDADSFFKGISPYLANLTTLDLSGLDLSNAYPFRWTRGLFPGLEKDRREQITSLKLAFFKCLDGSKLRIILHGPSSSQSTVLFPNLNYLDFTGSTYFDCFDNVWEFHKYCPFLKRGIGTVILSDGTAYVGQWVDGKKSGQGVCTYPAGINPNGIKYEGQWLNDQAVGPGVWTRADGTKTVVQA